MVAGKRLQRGSWKTTRYNHSQHIPSRSAVMLVYPTLDGHATKHRPARARTSPRPWRGERTSEQPQRRRKTQCCLTLREHSPLLTAPDIVAMAIESTPPMMAALPTTRPTRVSSAVSMRRTRRASNTHRNAPAVRAACRTETTHRAMTTPFPNSRTCCVQPRMAGSTGSARPCSALQHRTHRASGQHKLLLPRPFENCGASTAP